MFLLFRGMSKEEMRGHYSTFFYLLTGLPKNTQDYFGMLHGFVQ